LSRGVGESEVKRTRNMKPPSGARRRDVKRGKKYKKNEKRKIMKRKKKREYRGITNTKGR